MRKKEEDKSVLQVTVLQGKGCRYGQMVLFRNGVVSEWCCVGMALCRVMLSRVTLFTMTIRGTIVLVDDSVTISKITFYHGLCLKGKPWSCGHPVGG